MHQRSIGKKTYANVNLKNVIQRMAPITPNRALGWAQCSVLLFVGGFCTFHLLYPLRHFALYPAGVSWHEEGHLGAWHMKLRSKHGWVALVAEEGGGKRTVYVPQLDPLANGKQKKKIVSRPARS